MFQRQNRLKGPEVRGVEGRSCLSGDSSPWERELATCPGKKSLGARLTRLNTLKMYSFQYADHPSIEWFQKTGVSLGKSKSYLWG